MAHNEEFSGSKRLKGVPMISIVIPLYNEEENIQELYRRLIDVLDSMRESYEVLFIDDGSTDGSYARLLEIKKNNESIKIVKFRRNFGQTAAIHAGFDYAQGEIIATLDADLQNDPQDIPDMVKKLNDLDLDVVCGWRYQRQDKFDMKMGLTHTYAAAISEVHVLTTSYPAFSSNLIIDRSFLFVARSLASSAPVS